ncbi:MAG: BatD family protein [Candidatus Omnitrophota bacterium]
MKKSILPILLFIFLSGAFVFAETTVKAGVDRASLTTDQALTYKLEIDSSAKKIPQPKLPTFDGFVALSNAQTSQISISGGKQKTSVIYVFVLAPVKAGKFKIGSSEITIEGTKYSSDSFEIEVKQGKARPQAKPKIKPTLPKKSPPTTEEPQFTL